MQQMESRVFTYKGHSSVVNAVAWSPDGKRIASSSRDHTVQVWDAVDGGHVYTYQGHSSNVHTVAWSPDGKRIASASGAYFQDDNIVQVWNAVNGRKIITYKRHLDPSVGSSVVAGWQAHRLRLQ